VRHGDDMCNTPSIESLPAVLAEVEYGYVYCIKDTYVICKYVKKTVFGVGFIRQYIPIARLSDSVPQEVKQISSRGLYVISNRDRGIEV
jgi:hypothetical protein